MRRHELSGQMEVRQHPAPEGRNAFGADHALAALQKLSLRVVGRGVRSDPRNLLHPSRSPLLGKPASAAAPSDVAPIPLLLGNALNSGGGAIRTLERAYARARFRDEGGYDPSALGAGLRRLERAAAALSHLLYKLRGGRRPPGALSRPLRNPWSGPPFGASVAPWRAGPITSPGAMGCWLIE